MATDRGRRRRLQPVERTRLVDLAHTAMRESILSGDFAMRERLVETQLAEDLDMSRAPIREALRRLVKEGLVEEHPHRGAFVATVTASDITDLYNVRLGLEPIGVRLFMQRGASLEPLRRAIADMARGADRNRMAEIVRAEFEFHRSVALGSENQLLVKLFDDLEGRLTMGLALDDASFERLHDVAAEHVPIVEAIEAGEESAAVAVFEEHLVSTVGKLLERLGGDQSAVLQPLGPGRAPDVLDAPLP